jgi:hypothetical protein
MPTTTLGLNLISTSSPDYENGLSPVALISANWSTLDTKYAIEVESASGAIAIKEGFSVITKAGVAVMTLAAPTAGLPAAAGDDGRVLTIVSTTAQAHTVTTPSNKVNGASTTLTFGAAVANFVQLIAYGGVWYVLGKTGITVS